MPNRNFNNITNFTALNEKIISDGSYDPATIDTIGYSGGISFYAASPQPETNYTDGTYEFIMIHSDELTTGYESVPHDDTIGKRDLPFVSPFLSDLKITGTLAAGKAVPFVQATNLKRYVGLRLIATNVTDGALVQVSYVLSKDSQPVDRGGDDFAYFHG